MGDKSELGVTALVKTVLKMEVHLQPAMLDHGNDVEAEAVGVRVTRWHKRGEKVGGEVGLSVILADKHRSHDDGRQCERCGCPSESRGKSQHQNDNGGSKSKR